MRWKPLFPVITVKFPGLSIKYISAVLRKSVPATKQNRPATRAIVSHGMVLSAGGVVRQLREFCPVQWTSRLASRGLTDEKPNQQRHGDGKNFGTQTHSERHCSVTSTSTMPLPAFNPLIALPRIAPWALAWSLAFIA